MRRFVVATLLLGLPLSGAFASPGVAQTQGRDSHDAALGGILNGFVARWRVDVFESRDLAPPTEWKHKADFEWRVELPEPGLMRFFSANSIDPFTEFALRDGALVEATYTKGKRQNAVRTKTLLAEVEDSRNWTLVIEYPPSGTSHTYGRLEAVRMGDVLSWKESSADSEAGPYRVNYFGVSHAATDAKH